MPRFIDYIGLMLVNMSAGYFLLAAYVFRGIEGADQKRWSPAFSLVGLIALAFGIAMCMTWPVPGSYNIAYGEMSVLFGGIFLAAGIALGLGWDLSIIATYAFFAGIAAMIVGARIISLKMTLVPILSGTGFIVSGLGGVFAAPTLMLFKKNRFVRTIGALVLLLAAGIWAATVYPEYWAHLKMFQKWVPGTMPQMPGPKY